MVARAGGRRQARRGGARRGWRVTHRRGLEFPSRVESGGL